MVTEVGVEKGRRRRLVWLVAGMVAGASIALAIAVAIAPHPALVVIGGSEPQPPNVGQRIDAGQPGTDLVSTSGIYNAGELPVRLTRWEAIDPDGVEVLDVKLQHPWTYHGVGLESPTSPDADAVRQARAIDSPVPLPALGRKLAAEDHVQQAYGLLTRFRLQAGRTRGTVQGIRIFYETGRFWSPAASVDVYQGIVFCTPAQIETPCP